jgi:hypothetical protein
MKLTPSGWAIRIINNIVTYMFNSYQNMQQTEAPKGWQL